MDFSEAQLLERAAHGDQAAFEEIVKAHEKNVYTLALRMSHNREDALDLSQEIFLRVYKALPGFKGEASFSTWLYRLSYNLCVDHIRKVKRRNELPLTVHYSDSTEEQEIDWPDARYNPESEWEKKELRESIALSMEKLTPEQRAILTFREIQGLSYDEIARTLKLSEGTVKSRLARAREALRKILVSKGNYFDSDSSKSSREVNRHD